MPASPAIALTHSPAPNTLPFLGLEFAVAPAATWRDLLLRPAEPPDAGPAAFAYLVTPNVDHIVQLNKRPDLIPAYSQARWHVCDSRILEKLGRMRGLELGCYPGADLLADLLNDPRSKTLRVAVVGPDANDFARLNAVFPDHRFVHVEAPIMKPGSDAWETTLAATEASGADLYLLCISFPKQELFAHDLKQRGVARGQALCAGAGIDFLTGHQHRAPKIWRQLSLEWLYRLLSQPRRLWKRYLIDGPRIFWIYLKDGRR